MPRVSVIIPTYNRPALLREALLSVSEQTFTDYEIVVVDDGSTVPGVQDVCRAFPRCHYIYQENRGLSATRNRGIAEARGELIALLDDDDLWKPEKLEAQVKFLDRNPEIGVVHGPAEVIEADGALTGEVIGKNNPERRSGSVFRYAVRGSILKSPTPLARRQVFEDCGMFDEHLRLLYENEDVEFWARVAYRYKFGYIQEPMAYYRLHKGQTPFQDQKRVLNVHTYIAKKLGAYVEPKDRLLVREECCNAYLGTIGHSTSARSTERIRHLWKALRLWPPCIFKKRFWGLLLLA